MIAFLRFLQAEQTFWRGKKIDQHSLVVAAMIALENSFEQDPENKASQEYLLKQLREQKASAHLDVIKGSFKITRIADDDPTVQ